MVYKIYICLLFLSQNFRMPQALIAKIIIVSAFSLDVIVGGGRYQFFLDIHDMLDSSWIHSKYNVIGTAIQCASLCYRQREKCAYFGYKGDTCYLLKDTVDRNFCSQEDCTDSGMKVFKVKQLIYCSDYNFLFSFYLTIHLNMLLNLCSSFIL